MTRTRRPASGDALANLTCACASARQVARVLTQLYDRRLREAGLEAPQYALLMALSRQGPAGQGALGRRHALDKTTVSRNLGWLQRQGWIARSAGTGRERTFELTAAGRKQLAAALPAWKKLQAELRSAMTTREWDAMFRAFRSVMQAAGGVGGAA
jgi:DNA-binding MarR family transcriptional regulator